MNLKEIAKTCSEKSKTPIIEHKIKILFPQLYKNNSGLNKLHRQIKNSKWIQAISSEQREDGSWGKFHSQNSKLKQRYKTTEYAAKYLYHLGITRDFLIVDKACNYMEKLLNNKIIWPDAWEKNKWSPTGVELFIASKLALFGSEDEKYKKVLKKWISIIEAAFEIPFPSDKKIDEIAYEKLGVKIQNSYIGLHSINTIMLLAENQKLLSQNIQKNYLQWLHKYPKHIFYMVISLSISPENIKRDSNLTNWLLIMKSLSRFDEFHNEFSEELFWLESLRKDDKLWDLGKALTIFKLSDNWRKKINRRIDQTVYCLEILKNKRKTND